MRQIRRSALPKAHRMMRQNDERRSRCRSTERHVRALVPALGEGYVGLATLRPSC